MAEIRYGRQTPTQSVVIPYEKTLGQEAAELYEKTGNSLLEWQQLLQCDIMAVNDDGLWVHSEKDSTKSWVLFLYLIGRRDIVNKKIYIWL